MRIYEKELDPLVSVIIPVYNVEKYLSKCIESVREQTYKKLEIILVDDGADDTSGEICDRYAVQDARIKVIHKKHEGVSAARNAGLAICSGAYIGFVDSDDYIEPDLYRCAVYDALKYKCEIVFWGYRRVFESEGNKIKKMPSLNFDVVGCVNTEYAMMLAGGNYFTSIWNKLYKKEVCRLAESDSWITFDTDIDFGEDEIWLYKVLAQSKLIYIDNRALYIYRQHDGSISQKLNLEKMIMQIKVGERVSQIVQNIGADIRQMVEAKQYVRYYNALIAAYRSGENISMLKIKTKCKLYQKTYMKSSKIPLIGKIKKRLNIMLMDLHFPVWLVEGIDKIKR